MGGLDRRSFISGISVTTAAVVSGCSESVTGGGGSGPDEDSSGGGGSGPDEDSSGGGGSDPDEDSSGPGDPLQVVERYWSTWENQNANAHRELWHSGSPERQKEYWNDDQYWAEFGPPEKVDWTIEERGILESTPTSATTREVYIWRSPDRPTARVTDRHDLRTESGEWKLWKVTNQDVEELDGGETDSDEQPEVSGSTQFETRVEDTDTMITGQRETVTASVENVGQQAGESEIRFKLHTVEDEQTISLAPGQSTEVTFDFEVPDNPGSYNLRVANVAAEEVVRNSVSIISPEDAFELTEVINGDWECYKVSQFEEIESVDWEFEITNVAGIEVENEQGILEIRAYDGAKRTVGTFNSRGIIPSPGSPSVFRTNKEDMREESCDYVEAIVEGTNEEGGGLAITDAKL